ncbi:Pyruvate formate-lyase 1-activating enzyme [Parendozoicomonas haliclonae]|uniref:Pyruvate formate-lyase 1-activating enzyme n=2 Tax=Parendozoicomonas haliclonae TaxID=1960125 RepID=A0A1X7AKX6_9GAMM|nr:Pyruvate formate-lyase 1-activating enzyme [Parendozoicomonas haliclonae]
MAQDMSIDDLLQQMTTAAPFLTGVTVSGGESTMQLKFVRQLFAAIKAHPQLSHLTCLIDSNGYLSTNSWRAMLDEFDGAMIDLKAMNNELHQWLTGKGNQRVLDTIRFLDQHNKLTELRFLAIPEITDTPEELSAIQSFIKELRSDFTLKVNAFSNKAVKGEARQWSNLPTERAQDIKELLISS